jgi:CheY-like chemotaxis protein
LGQHTEQKGLAFYDRTAAWTLPEISVDVTRLKQALVNLLSNAVKYNRDGGTVTLSVEEGRDGMFRITVIDTGPGIAEEKQDQLFTPFARLGLENSDITGTGIGLTITKDLTEAMGGAIGFKSTLGLGSRFWLEFPVVGGSLAPRASGDIPAAGDGDGVGAGKYTVLCVEDNPSSLKLVETIIERIPDTVMISAHTGELGVDLAEIHRPNVILMDIDLPGIDGFEALKRLKSSPATKHIPVIALTAKASRADRNRGMEAGFKIYLTKPINVEEVESAVKEHLA